MVAAMGVILKELASQTEKAKQTYEEISKNIYRGKGVGDVGHGEDYRCKDNPNKACGEYTGCVNRELFIECVDGECPCGSYCQNRRFQDAKYADVDVIFLPLKGYGLRVLQPLKKNQFVMEYLGEVIKNDVFMKRMKKYNEEGLKHFYFMSLQAGEVIDATDKGCVARFMNHSCAPNCYVQKWMVGEKYRIGIFALRNVQEGEELTFDYNAERYGSEAQACHCGEPNCRGIIGGTKETGDSILSQDLIEAEQLKPIQSCDDVLPFISLMLRSIEKPAMITNDISILKMFMKLHGSIMLKTYLREYKDNDDIVEKTLIVADKLPYKYNNRRVESSHLKEWVSKFTSRNDRIGELCQSLIEKWQNLPEFYKIPKYSERGLLPPEAQKKEVEEMAMDIDTPKNSETSESKEDHPMTDHPMTDHQMTSDEYYFYESAHDFYVRFTDSHFPFQHLSQRDYWASQKLSPHKQPNSSQSEYTHCSSSYLNDHHNTESSSSSSSRYSKYDKYSNKHWHNRTYGSSQSPAVPPQPELPPLAPNWCETTDEYGHVYYYNKYTKETSWERPVVKDDMKTIDGFSKAELQGIIERAEALAKKAEKEKERAARERVETNKIGVTTTLSHNLSERDFRNAIAAAVVDYCSRFKRHMDVQTFKKQARTLSHLVQDKELRRSEWRNVVTYRFTDEAKARIKSFVIDYMRKLVSRIKSSAEKHK
ncbi:3083_t:CDS:10, partial [Scutellospora calospora]